MSNDDPELLGSIELAGTDETLAITSDILWQSAQKFLAAVKKAGEVYRAVEKAKGAGNFIPEVSMDETDRAQSPAELLIILAAIADEGTFRVQTIALQIQLAASTRGWTTRAMWRNSSARWASMWQPSLTRCDNTACQRISN